jgi:hypothetical protein
VQIYKSHRADKGRVEEIYFSVANEDGLIASEEEDDVEKSLSWVGTKDLLRPANCRLL